jgi:membrane protein implicated in regulation of membrane protease activity
LTEKPGFEAKCTRARGLQADLMDDKILEAAEACNEDNYQSTKVKISAYQWRASKLAPKKYGERVDVEHAGGLSLTVEHIGAGMQPKPAPEECQ